ncbi:MAG: MFS transporter [Rhodospirillales bacterium]
MTDGNARPLPRRVIVAYALPAAAIALPTIPVFIHLPALYGDTLGVGLAATGVALLVARLFDTVTDPLIGWLSDRVPIWRHRRKPWIVLGAVIAGPALHQLLVPEGSVDAAYLTIWSVVLYAGWTLIAVPYMAWGAELSSDYGERARITSWRETASLTGIITAAVLGAAVAGSEPDGFEGPSVVATTTIALGLLFIPALLAMVPDAGLPRIADAPARGVGPVFAAAVTLFRNGPFTRLLFAWFVNGIANGIPAALFFLYLDHGLGVGAADRPIFVLVYFLAAVVAIPLWYRISLDVGKHRTWCLAMLVTSAGFLCVALLAALPHDSAVAGFLIICAITGAGLGADLALPPAIQADVADYDQLRHRRSRVGLQFALWGMATKLALALAVGTALPALEALGFDPSAVGSGGSIALVTLYAVVPVMIKLAAVSLVWNFPITPARHAVIRRRLATRRRAA